MGIDVGTLKAVDLFAELNAEELKRIAAIAEQSSLCEGEVFMRRGEAASTLFVVLNGNFMIYFQGNRSFTLHNRGNIMGWSTLIEPYKYTGSGVAMTKSSLITFPGDTLQKILAQDTVLKDKIMKRINNIVAERVLYVKDAIASEGV